MILLIIALYFSILVGIGLTGRKFLHRTGGPGRRVLRGQRPGAVEIDVADARETQAGADRRPGVQGGDAPGTNDSKPDRHGAGNHTRAPVPIQ